MHYILEWELGFFCGIAIGFKILDLESVPDLKGVQPFSGFRHRDRSRGWDPDVFQQFYGITVVTSQVPSVVGRG